MVSIKLEPISIGLFSNRRHHAISKCIYRFYHYNYNSPTAAMAGSFVNAGLMLFYKIRWEIGERG